ncbi:tyrosine-protein phosphatase [Streptomyces atratus]|uniref:tyrosine-protein phosphatase n=1 Tax=Streptomyces atratus TaxID=1893 RepID=UPI00367E6C3F
MTSKFCIVNRHIAFERLHNFRDVGGYRGYGGRPVRWGRLYRSESLGKLRGGDDSRVVCSRACSHVCSPTGQPAQAPKLPSAAPIRAGTPDRPVADCRPFPSGSTWGDAVCADGVRITRRRAGWGRGCSSCSWCLRRPSALPHQPQPPGRRSPRTVCENPVPIRCAQGKIIG